MTQPIEPAAAAVAVVDDLAARQRKIAAIHALGQWYTDHPDEPMPHYVTAFSRTTQHEGQEVDRVMDVLDFHKRTDATLSEDWYEVTARLELLQQDGMKVSVRRTAALKQEFKRYT